MNCPQNYLQIEKDLLPFNQINLEELAKEAVGRFGTHHAICHYSLINNQVCNNIFSAEFTIVMVWGLTSAKALWQ